MATLAIRLLFITALLGIIATPTFGAGISQILVDENGHMVIDSVPAAPGVLGTDPISGNTALIYQLPYAGVVGDVFVNSGMNLLDLIRFPGNGTLEYFSKAGAHTTLSAATAVGDTNVKVAFTGSFTVGHPVQIGLGFDTDTLTVQAVGTSGSSGTGITFTSPVTFTHANGAPTFWILPDLSDVVTFTLSGNPAAQIQRVNWGSNYTALWQPGATGVGGDLDNPNVQYVFQNNVPEPACLTLLGVCGLALMRRRTRSDF